MMPWWVWLIPLLGIAVLLWLYFAQSIHRRRVSFGRLRPVLCDFISEGRPESVMVLEREDEPGLLQLRLHAEADTGWSTECGIPNVDWSAEHFDHVAEAVIAAGFSLRTEGGGCGKVRSFLRASTGDLSQRPCDRSWEMVGIVAHELGWDAATPLTVRLELPVGGRASGRLRRFLHQRRPD
jgi:hypothetical protein